MTLDQLDRLLVDLETFAKSMPRPVPMESQEARIFEDVLRLAAKHNITWRGYRVARLPEAISGTPRWQHPDVVSELWQAMGLASTLKPDLDVSAYLPNNPLAMMKHIVQHVINHNGNAFTPFEIRVLKALTKDYVDKRGPSNVGPAAVEDSRPGPVGDGSIAGAINRAFRQCTDCGVCPPNARGGECPRRRPALSD